MRSQRSPSFTNLLLTALPPGEYRRLAPQLELVSLEEKHVLYLPNEPITHVYFPENAVIPILARLHDGRTVEMGIVGHEGIVGLPALLGTSKPPYLYIALTGGAAYRMPAEVLTAEFKRGGVLQDLLLRYTQARLSQSSLISACNYFHPLIKRLCRWLLMVYDRIGADELSLTQETIARVLRVRRTGVTEAVGTLQQRKLLTYHYGRIRLLDRGGLERAACECYRPLSDVLASLR